MTDRPILFSASMVRAIRAGHKTQTRRVAKPYPFSLNEKPADVVGFRVRRPDGSEEGAFVRPCPYGKPGDRLWVRENCWAHKDTGEIFGYCAEDETLYDDNKTVKKVPSIHMPRSKCRLMLEIIAVRIERLHDISAADAIAEGIRPAANPTTIDCDTPDPRIGFRHLWKSINGVESWRENPFVWIVEFRKVDKHGD